MPLIFNISFNRKQIKQSKRPFKFKNMWVNDEDCKRVIAEGWDGMGTNNISDLAIEMDRCGERLKRWNR